MNQERLELLKEYLRIGEVPLLIEDISSEIFDNEVKIDSSIDIDELNGHFEDIEFCPPKWYKELEEKSKKGHVLLVIENINNIPIVEQKKFIEIIKYRKVSTFELPKNCLIVATCNNLNESKINEEVYSLFAQI